MSILKTQTFVAALLLSTLLGTLPKLWAATETATETLQWVNLINTVETQPTQPTTLLAVDQFLANFPQSSRKSIAQFMRGEVLLRQSNFTQAFTQFQGIPNLSSQVFGDDLLYRLGECAYNLGHYPQAQNYWDQLYVQFPNSRLRADVLAMRGRVLLEQKKTTDAALAFRDLLARFPHYQVNSLYALGGAQLELTQGHPQEALELIKLQHSPEARYWKSKIYAELHQYASGIDLLAEVWSSPSLDEKLALAGFWMLQWMNAGQWSQALTAADRLSSEMASSPILKNDLHAVRGHCLFKLQRYAEAVAAYTTWLDAKPEGTDPALNAVYQNLAQAYYKLGKDSDAMSMYKKHLQLQPAGEAVPPLSIQLPQNLEQACEVARKAILIARNPRVSAPWLNIIAAPPVLTIQPPRSPMPMKSWTLTISDEQQVQLNQQTGGTQWPDKLTWDGEFSDGRRLLAGVPFHYTISLTGTNGKTLSTQSATKQLTALSYTRRDVFYISIVTTALFEKNNQQQLSSFGHSLLKETSSLCLTHSRQGLRIEISAADPAVGQRQAKAIIAHLQTTLEWPEAWIASTVVASQAPAKERVLIQCLRP